MKLKPFNSIGAAEHAALVEFAGDIEDTGFPLSGYLAGKERGGFQVCRLESAWAKTFKVKHAIACNSATSGLLAAAFAVGLTRDDRFVCPAMTMSATAAAPMFTGATPYFCDVNDENFSLDMHPPMEAVFVTNLFGHPAHLSNIRKFCDELDCFMIEDNAQSPFAMEGDKYTGTIGHIGVFSLNVHKPIQCGEGGMVVTDDDSIAYGIRCIINHGENAFGGILGLNLRMPEVCAAIGLQQLMRGSMIVGSRVTQAQAILAAIGDIPGIRPPLVREGCTHVYYAIPFLIEDRRAAFCAALREQGVPIVEGYVPPLYRLPAFSAFARPCPVAEDLHDRRLFYFENCAYDPTPEQIEQIGDAFRKAAKSVL